MVSIGTVAGSVASLEDLQVESLYHADQELVSVLDDGVRARTVSTAVSAAGKRPLLVLRFLLWISSWLVPGVGMFCVAYFVFAVGNLEALWKEEYPACWVEHQGCSTNLADSIHYTQVCGMIGGHLFLGFAADRLGRKWGSVLTAAFMLVFGILIAASSGPSVHALFLMFTITQFFFGIGVGGEYPVASTSANERAEASAELSDKRGQTVVLVFSMQGWGNLVNTLVILAIMAGFGQYGPQYDALELEVTWRLSYAIGCVPLAAILVYRTFFLRESEVWQGKKRAMKRMGEDKSGFGMGKLCLLLRHYWHRVGGTALCWFVWDFAFFGNKLFQSQFIKVINPEASLIEVLEWTLLNNSVALVGYYFAAAFIDKPWMGRKRMQAMGFGACFVLFLICAAAYDQLVTPRWIHAFQFLYYFSSFWGQFGPNATTWLLPAETMPTEVRSMCHGFSAAVGKVGAIIAGVAFGMVDNRTKFWISAFCGLVGALATLLTIPDLTGLDLREGDRRWLAIVHGVGERYSGEAVNPRHLSLLERLMGYARQYDPTPSCAGTGPVTAMHTALPSTLSLRGSAAMLGRLSAAPSLARPVGGVLAAAAAATAAAATAESGSSGRMDMKAVAEGGGEGGDEPATAVVVAVGVDNGGAAGVAAGGGDGGSVATPKSVAGGGGVVSTEEEGDRGDSDPAQGVGLGIAAEPQSLHHAP